MPIEKELNYSDKATKQVLHPIIERQLLVSCVFFFRFKLSDHYLTSVPRIETLMANLVAIAALI